jgi:hypothetical protein
MFQLSGDLIDGKSAYLWLVEKSKNVNSDISICSAFLRSSIIEVLSKNFQPEVSVRVMVRWQLGDLLAGASDLKSYELCSELGWKFFISLKFHGKVFHLPSDGILVGSANATESGFGLLSNSNSEACTIVAENDSNIKFVNHLFENSIEMNDDLFEKMQAIFDQALIDKNSHEWPKEILEELSKSDGWYKKLFISECFKTNGEELLAFPSHLSQDAKSDLSLLGLVDRHPSLESIGNKFTTTKIFSLLFDLLDESGGEIYFGALTSALHDWLVEDPAPHRREVKVLVKNLYCWIASLGSDITGMAVDRPNHSERIRKI